MKDNIVIRRLIWIRTLLTLAMGACLTTGALAASDPRSCSMNANSQELDYWVGDWTITNPGASGSSTSKVERSLDQCLFVEHWDNGKGYTGQTMFAYSPDDHRWYGMFADNRGHVHIFTEGSASAGTAEFHGTSLGPNGETVLNRIRVVRLAPNKVEQTWEKSTDYGASWTTVFHGEYQRANP